MMSIAIMLNRSNQAIRHGSDRTLHHRQRVSRRKTTIFPGLATEEMNAAFNSEDDENKSVLELTLNFAEAFKHLPPQAPVGCENTVTVLHIPLVVPSKNFLDNDASGSTSRFEKSTVSPIAILSIMSPIFPYPPDLQKLLKSLSPHIAIGFMKASIHAGVTAQLASFTKSHFTAMQTTTSRIGSRRFANSMHGVRSLAPSVNSQSLEKRNSTDTLGAMLVHRRTVAMFQCKPTSTTCAG